VRAKRGLLPTMKRRRRDSHLDNAQRCSLVDALSGLNEDCTGRIRRSTRAWHATREDSLFLFRGNKKWRKTLIALCTAVVARRDSLLVSCQLQQSSTVPCPGTDYEGYLTINAINSDMQAELEYISNGGVAQSSYDFVFCPNQALDANLATLRPVLNGANFICGSAAQPGEDCRITGGDEQVRIEPSTIPGYTLEEITFVGLTFAGFSTNGDATGTSIAALASGDTTVNFIDTRWTVSVTSSWPK
jgi:hypothetical protein